MMSGIRKACMLGVVIFLSVLKISAQAPGYMGKRFSAGYGVYGHPAFNSIARGFGNYAINTLHEVFIECALDKKFSLGLAGQFFRYRYNNKAEVTVPSTYSSVFGVQQAAEHPDGNYLIKGRNFKLYGKFFKESYLAPWGKYFTLGVALNRYLTVYNPDEMGIEGVMNVTTYPTGAVIQQPFYYNDFGATTRTFQSVDLFFGNGNSRIIANKISLDYGYTIGCVAMTQMIIDALDEHTLTPDKYIEKTAKSRAAALNRFNFYLKIGYLF